ncbi:MAG: hypothetical protein NTW85_13165 [Methylococcales bacterium]|nr:hypothetical protein [Methylococcales bacterium]
MIIYYCSSGCWVAKKQKFPSAGRVIQPAPLFEFYYGVQGHGQNVATG